MSTLSSSIQAEFSSEVVMKQTIPPKSGSFTPISNIIQKKYADRLDIDSLYTHQAETLTKLQNNENVCLTTGTDSGKTLTYALYSAIQATKNGSTTLCVYPTKALARDQKDTLQKIYSKLKLDSITVGVYDGDTPKEEKRNLREDGDIILTNFQGLNYYLPHHESWESFYSNLGLVVIDEAHMYTGIMGSHTAWICRRLFRVVESIYKASPQVALTTATLGNPQEHAELLTGKSVSVIDTDASPQAEQNILFWNPQKEDGSRTSPHTAVTTIAPWIVKEHNKQILVFAPSRRVTELCMRWIQDKHNSLTVESYHSGHSKQERRETESKIKNGLIDIVISTTALEVGINIGSIDVVITDTYPGSRMSFQQQIGRAGRDNTNAEAIFIANNSSVDQYIMDNPPYLLDDTNIEQTVIDLSNEYIATKHITVAASEHPLLTDDDAYFGTQMEDIVHKLQSKNILSGSLSIGVTYEGSGRPESNISIYTSGASEFSVQVLDQTDDSQEVAYSLPNISRERAYREFFEGATYLHKGNQYIVENFIETDSRKAVQLVKSNDVDYYTQSNREKEVTNISEDSKVPLGLGITIHKGTVTLEERYPTYTKIYDTSDERITGIPTGIESSITLHTEAIWFTFEKEFAEEMSSRTNGDLLGSLHGYEHALIELSPTILNIDDSDMGGLSMPTHKETNKPTIFIYDGVDGGIGYSYKLFTHIQQLSEIVSERILNCECSDPSGCLECIMSESCGSQNQPLNTVGSAIIAKTIAEL